MDTTWERPTFEPEAGRWTRYPTLAEQAADWIGQQIINHHWHAGRRITENEVAEALGISRVPVREAFRALSEYGLISLVPRVGAIAGSLSTNTVRQIYETRALLESWMLRRGVPLLTDQDVNLISRATSDLQLMLTLASDRYYEFAWAVRCEIYRFCGNDVAVETADQLRRRLSSFPRLLWTSTEQRKESATMHLNLASACSSRDGEAAADLISNYLLATSSALAAHIDGLRADSQGQRSHE